MYQDFRLVSVVTENGSLEIVPYEIVKDMNVNGEPIFVFSEILEKKINELKMTGNLRTKSFPSHIIY